MLRVNATKLLVEDEKLIESKTGSGIILPSQITKPNNMRGKILLKGEGTPDIPIVHEIGDTAIYHPRSGTVFTCDGKDVRLIDVSDVFLSGVD